MAKMEEKNAEAHVLNVQTVEMKGSVQEAVYSAEELAAAHHKQFSCRKELVMAALRQAGKSQYTLAEAKEIVEAFRKKPVKKRGA